MLKIFYEKILYLYFHFEYLRNFNIYDLLFNNIYIITSNTILILKKKTVLFYSSIVSCILYMILNYIGMFIFVLIKLNQNYSILNEI